MVSDSRHCYFRTFSILKKVSWPVLSENFCSLRWEFQQEVASTFGDDVKITVRKFRKSSKCRFTVIFSDFQEHPDEVFEKVTEVVDNTVRRMVLKHNNKSYL